MYKSALLILLLTLSVAANKKFYRYFTKGEYRKAIEYVENKVSEKNRDSDIWHHLGIAYEEEGNFERALTCHLRSNREEESHNALVAIARLYNSLGHYGQAVIFAHKALKYAPESTQAEWEKVRGDYHMRRLVDVDKRLKQVIEKDPDNFIAQEYLGLYLFDNKGYSEALPYLKKVLSNGKHVEDIRYKVAVCNIETKDVNAAKPLLKLVLKDQPKNDDARIMLARAYSSTGDNGLALAEYARVTETSKLATNDLYNVFGSFSLPNLPTKPIIFFSGLILIFLLASDLSFVGMNLSKLIPR